MKKEEIERLLTRYYDGLTTEQEEASLLRAFQSVEGLPEDPLFCNQGILHMKESIAWFEYNN